MKSDSEQLRDFLREAVASQVPSIQQGFDDYQNHSFISRPPEFFCLELCGEAGELANIEKKRWRGNQIDEEHRADEAADVFISLMNFCNAAGIDLAKAVESKLARIDPSKKR